MCGLEIHQRLSGKKLFVQSPCPPADDKNDGKGRKGFIRKLRAVASELGAMDAAAAFEQSRERTIKYTANPDFVSLMEADEEPPTQMNAGALAEAIRICNAFGSTLVDEVHVMRKAVVDGSNTSGFQRTSVIAFGGKVETSHGAVGLQAICLEEESGIPAGEDGGRTIYDIDRLGIPLVEIATEPTIVSGAHAREVGEKIGYALRMSPAVMRGLGTIRQDVNISVEGGARIEIKGVQDISILPALVENEIKRQEGLIAISKELQKKFGGKTDFQENFIDVSQIFPSTSCAIISKALKSGGAAIACRLPKFSGILGRELYAGRRYGSELSDYAKASGGVKGLIHSDEDMGKYKISEDELGELQLALGMKAEDAFVIIADSAPKAERAIMAVLGRAKMLDVPKETRRADDAGGSSFMRPLPGSARMYPETDIAPIRISKEMRKDALSNPLSDFEDKKKELISLLGADLGGQMIKSRHLALFERLVENGADAKLAAVTLEQTMTSLRRENIEVEKINEKQLGEIFALYGDGKIAKSAIREILKLAAANPDGEIAALAKSNSLLRISGKALDALWHNEGGDIKTFMSKYRLVVEAGEVAGLAGKGK